MVSGPHRQTSDAPLGAALDALETLQREWETAPTGRTLHEAAWRVIQAHGPEWLRRAWYQRWAPIQDSDALSVDETFGRAWPKGTRRGSAREMRLARTRCHDAVLRVFRADPARAIDEALYEEAAGLVFRETGDEIGERTVRRRYREAVEQLGFIDMKDLRS
jgi:hypothetical protein